MRHSSPERRLPAGIAKEEAQKLAFAPIAFFAALALRDTGLLTAVEGAGRDGAPTEQLAERAELSAYAASVLLDFGADIGLVERCEEHFVLAPLGHVVLHDAMTRVNMDFTRDVVYRALPDLETAVREQRPAGLHTLGPWQNLYEGLAELPEPAATSWSHFNHFYSDRAFSDLVPALFEHPVQHLVDIGGHTGRLALQCLHHDPRVHVTLIDLPSPLATARERIDAAGHGARVTCHESDILADDAAYLPTGADAIVMSHFLTCFSEAEIATILARTVQAMDSGTRLYVVELCPDRQVHDAARYSLNAASLYFTCVANGTSRFHRSDRLVALLQEAGFRIEREIEGLGVGHTVFCCRRANPA